MSNCDSRQACRQKVEDFLRNQRFKEALDLLSRVESSRELDTTELLSKGRAIMLASEEIGLPLAAAEEAFKSALTLDPENVAALLELAWYYHSVEDDPHRAFPLFERAIKVSRQQLTEAARGRADCLAELESATAAATSLRTLHEAALIVKNLNEEEQEWLDTKSE